MRWGSRMSQSHSDQAPLELVSRSAAATVTQPEFLEDGDDHAFRQMVHDALAFSARLEAVRDGFARLIGLSGVQYTILISVYHLQVVENVGVTRVAEHLHLSGAFITNETNKLVAKVLLEKHPDPQDGRRLILRTTPEAQRRLARLAEVQAEVNDEHFAPLAETGAFDQFRRIMAELVQSTDRALALLNGLSPRAVANGLGEGTREKGAASK